MPLVSVIIPTYGNPQFLDKAINSVLNQTFKDLELIVVDDNDPGTEPRYRTHEIIQSFDDSRLRYIEHPYNKNGAAARNTGISQARGAYISFLDSDDEYFPTRIEKCLAALKSNDKNIAGVYSGCEFRRGGKCYNRFTDVISGNFFVETLACSFMFCSGSNIFVRRSVIEELHGFDETFLRHQDYEFLVRLFRKYQLKAIPELLIVKNNENFNLPNLDKQIAIKEQYFEKFKTEIESLSDSDRHYVYHCNAVAIAENALKHRKFSVAFNYYVKAFRHRYLSFKELSRLVAITMLSIFKR